MLVVNEKRRKVLTGVRIWTETKARAVAAHKRHRLDMPEFLDRLVTWFSEQPLNEQERILGLRREEDEE